MKKRIISIALAVMLVLTAAMSVAPAEKAQAGSNCPNCWGSFYNNTVSESISTSTLGPIYTNPQHSHGYYVITVTITKSCSICGWSESYVSKSNSYF